MPEGQPLIYCLFCFKSFRVWKEYARHVGGHVRRKQDLDHSPRGDLAVWQLVLWESICGNLLKIVELRHQYEVLTHEGMKESNRFRSQRKQEQKIQSQSRIEAFNVDSSDDSDYEPSESSHTDTSSDFM